MAQVSVLAAAGLSADTEALINSTDQRQAPTYVLEIHTRSLNQYHRLHDFPVRIGRALDNDIILSDVTVSEHHLEIDLAADGSLLIHNLSTENGSKINRQALDDQVLPLALKDEPVNLVLGKRRARLLTSDMAVNKTRVRNCSGLYLLFCKPAWSVALMLFTLFVFLFDNYLQTIYAKEPSYYLSDLMPHLLAMIVLTLGAAGISRVSIQRWEIGAALSFAALLMLGPQLIGELGHKLNYLLTATWPMDWLVFTGDFLWMPALLYLYVRLVHHADALPAVGLALLFSAPLLLYQAADYADQLALSDEFTGEANFSRELSSLDIRSAPTLSIDEFIARVDADLGVDEIADKAASSN